MEWIIIIIVVVIIIAAINSRNKENGIEAKEHIPNKEIEDLYSEYVRIGYETLTSLEMLKGEKTKLIRDILSSIKEIDVDSQREIIFEIMRQSYLNLIDKFEFDTDIHAEISTLYEEFERQVADGSREYIGWTELIDVVERGKKRLRNITEEPEHSFSISFAIKGLKHRTDEEQGAAHQLSVEDELVLECEPDNEYDKYAVKVMTTDGVHIGYVEANKAKKIFEKLGKLVECKVKQISEYEELYIYGLAFFE